MQAFEVVARPALDSAEAVLDRVKMATYIQCARFGVPCPLTGDTGRVVAASDEPQQQKH